MTALLRRSPGSAWLAPVALLGLAILALALHFGRTCRAGAPGTSPTPQRLARNRLSREKSPYLLQHADNPVDWYPWGAEAFEKARREDKPIFLSVGYSTCHWCHVMARESFSDPDVAALLNANFVAVKVDREERPDVDRVYMAYVTASTGRGGWPMTVWLTPDRKPFFGGTYFPPDSKYGMPGLKQVLPRIASLWKSDRKRLASSADASLAALRQIDSPHADSRLPGVDRMEAAFGALSHAYDRRQGGFGNAPRFPRPATLIFLARWYARTGDRSAMDMAVTTLRAMAVGGIHDHLGGGFHRYSTDARWHVPHFEKMLYDQAQLVVAYLEAWQVTGEPEMSATARDVLAYVARDMTDADGAFYSAEDADSPRPDPPHGHAEGAFYVWKAEEIDAALGPTLAPLFKYAYGVKSNGSVDASGDLAGQNVLFQEHSVGDTAAHFHEAPEHARKDLERARALLRARRNLRPRPHRDDKIVAGWNGLMISAFSRAAQVLGDSASRARAERAARFVKKHLVDAHAGTLLHYYRHGAADVPGFNQDYAQVIQGLLDLYEASFDVHWLQLAARLQEKELELFWGGSDGFYESAGTDASILIRTRERYDSAEPASNSTAALNLLRLSQMLDRKDFRARAEAILRSFSATMAASPDALPQMLAALDFARSPKRQIVVAGRPSAADTRRLAALIHHWFIPNKILLLADAGPGQAFLSSRLPFLTGVRPAGGRATAYVCENYACRFPTADPAKVRDMLKEMAARPYRPLSRSGSKASGL